MLEFLIKREAGSGSDHDVHYSNALRGAYSRYADKTRDELLVLQESARLGYRLDGGTHRSTAACVVINELLRIEG